ncbi:unnamed protein product [Trichogramma brassicae]|uniref:Uncharacterized protein n=1 Tax=Trichogramma brassicae TaxID=86971 RepID=A0A6H5IQU6_9HYME|nr:unnamed protein product [Trichogramma brassicae]
MRLKMLKRDDPRSEARFGKRTTRRGCASRLFSDLYDLRKLLRNNVSANVSYKFDFLKRAIYQSSSQRTDCVYAMYMYEKAKRSYIPLQFWPLPQNQRAMIVLYKFDRFCIKNNTRTAHETAHRTGRKHQNTGLGEEERAESLVRESTTCSGNRSNRKKPLSFAPLCILPIHRYINVQCIYIRNRYTTSARFASTCDIQVYARTYTCIDVDLQTLYNAALSKVPIVKILYNVGYIMRERHKSRFRDYVYGGLRSPQSQSASHAFTAFLSCNVCRSSSIDLIFPKFPDLERSCVRKNISVHDKSQHFLRLHPSRRRSMLYSVQVQNQSSVGDGHHATAHARGTHAPQRRERLTSCIRNYIYIIYI